MTKNSRCGAQTLSSRLDSKFGAENVRFSIPCWTLDEERRVLKSRVNRGRIQKEKFWVSETSLVRRGLTESGQLDLE